MFSAVSLKIMPKEIEEPMRVAIVVKESIDEGSMMEPNRTLGRETLTNSVRQDLLMDGRSNS